MTNTKKTIDWRKKFQTNFGLYGGRLSVLYGFTDYDIGVYVFLLTRKWYTKEFQFSKNGISNEMNSIPKYFFPDGFKSKYDARKVESSLIKLESHGFVSKCKNNPKKKASHRNPNYIYESRAITDLQPEIEEDLETKKKDMLGLLGELGNIEEDALYFKGQVEEKNGKA